MSGYTGYGPIMVNLQDYPYLAVGKMEVFFTKIGIIVMNQEQALEIQKMLTGYFIAGSNNYDTPFSRKLILNSFIIVLNEVINAVENGNIRAQTIEAITEESLIQPVTIFNNCDELLPLIRATIEKAKIAGAQAAHTYMQNNELDEELCGYANIVSHDIMTPIIQKLIQMGIGSGPYDGKVYIHVAGKWPFDQSMGYNTFIEKAMCEVFVSNLGEYFHVESWLD